MKALLSHTAGKAESLQFGTLPDPVAGPGQVLIRVKACSLNYPDALMIEDLYQFKPERPFAPGNEVSGVIEAVGDGVEGFKAGDRVCALCGHGGLAELVAVDAWRCFVIPGEMPFDVASTIIMAYGTNIHGLVDRGALKAGDSMLVLGASGGIGITAVELGKAMGARVVGAVSSPEKAEYVKQAGADEVIVYPTGALDREAQRALANQFKAACPQGYEVVYDVVGGDYAEPALRSIAWEGRYLVIGFTAGIPKIPTNLALLKACSIVGVFWGAWSERNRGELQKDMAELFQLWREGKIKPLISRNYAFADAAQAIDLMANRGAIGKLVVTMD
jgi:NADPH:quinone reductase-like Zn-dependent oxidoreductase